MLGGAAAICAQCGPACFAEWPSPMHGRFGYPQTERQVSHTQQAVLRMHSLPSSRSRPNTDTATSFISGMAGASSGGCSACGMKAARGAGSGSKQVGGVI